MLVNHAVSVADEIDQLGPCIEFTVPGDPKGKGRPRASMVGGHARLYTPAATRSEEGVVRLFASQAMAGRNPIVGPVSMEIIAVSQVPQSWSGKKRAAALRGDVRPTTKPDADNTAKLICDGMNKIVFNDDAQIVRLVVEKRYGDQPRVDVVVRPIV